MKAKQEKLSKIELAKKDYPERNTIYELS